MAHKPLWCLITALGWNVFLSFVSRCASGRLCSEEPTNLLTGIHYGITVDRSDWRHPSWKLKIPTPIDRGISDFRKNDMKDLFPTPTIHNIGPEYPLVEWPRETTIRIVQIEGPVDNDPDCKRYHQYLLSSPTVVLAEFNDLLKRRLRDLKCKIHFKLEGYVYYPMTCWSPYLRDTVDHVKRATMLRSVQRISEFAEEHELTLCVDQREEQYDSRVDKTNVVGEKFLISRTGTDAEYCDLDTREEVAITHTVSSGNLRDGINIKFSLPNFLTIAGIQSGQDAREINIHYQGNNPALSDLVFNNRSHFTLRRSFSIGTAPPTTASTAKTRHETSTESTTIVHAHRKPKTTPTTVAQSSPTTKSTTTTVTQPSPTTKSTTTTVAKSNPTTKSTTTKLTNTCSCPCPC